MGTHGRLRLIEAFAKAWTARDLDALMEMMSEHPEFRASVGPEPGRTFSGRDEVRSGFEQFLGGRGPEPEAVPEPTLVCEDFAVTRWRLRWPDEDASPDVHGCDVFEFDGDRISLKDTFRKVDG
ncbi:MAG: nuclear transport factor 2 family protein [Solirubrobacterales bacterium]